MTTNSSGQSVITFGHHSPANPYAEWVLKRSTDLINYNEELYRFDGTTGRFSDDAIGSGLSGAVFEIIDSEAAGEERFFSRFEAELKE